MSKTENVEALLINWLDSEQTWSVYADVPKSLPEKFILVERESGGRNAMVLDMASLSVDVYHKTSRITASNKANSIADGITGILAEVDDITKASVNSIIHIDDKTREYHRYRVYLDIYHRR